MKIGFDNGSGLIPRRIITHSRTNQSGKDLTSNKSYAVKQDFTKIILSSLS